MINVYCPYMSYMHGYYTWFWKYNSIWATISTEDRYALSTGINIIHMIVFITMFLFAVLLIQMISLCCKKLIMCCGSYYHSQINNSNNI